MRDRSEPKFTRAMMVLLPLANAFRRRGGDIEAVLARHRIPAVALTDPTLLVEASVCYAATEDMADTLGDLHFGAQVAIETANKGTPGLRDAARHATTLGGFLSRVIVEVATQVDNVRYQFSATSRSASFEVQRTLRVSGPTTQVDAIGIAFYVTVIKRGLGATFDPERILVTAPTNAGLPPGLLSKRAFVRSGINGLRISFPPDWLWAPFSLDWDLAETSRGEFDPDSAAKATISHFRCVLTENIGHQDLSLNRFAAICGLHPRRVQRILAAQGTSYRKMKDAVRRSVTEDLLSNTGEPIAEIAFQVGLSGPSALDRAFRQWTGKTPSRFRAEAAPERDT